MAFAQGVSEQAKTPYTFIEDTATVKATWQPGLEIRWKLLLPKLGPPKWQLAAEVCVGLGCLTFSGITSRYRPPTSTLSSKKGSLSKLPQPATQEAFAGVVGGLSSVVAQNLQLKLAPRNRSVASTKGNPEILNPR